jgi:hypothetical protein
MTLEEDLNMSNEMQRYAPASLSQLLASSAGLLNRTSGMVDRMITNMEAKGDIDPEIVMRAHEMAISGTIQIMEVTTKLLKIAKDNGRPLDDDDLDGATNQADAMAGGLGESAANSRSARLGLGQNL